MKTMRQFLGHAGFYRRFIKDFSKIAKPLYKLLEKMPNSFGMKTARRALRNSKPT